MSQNGTCGTCGHYIPHPKESGYNCSKHEKWVRQDEIHECFEKIHPVGGD